ncbi:DUF3343 domain-containing protein [Deltaproteobacteria bacterium OttesenSCG-928-K17]|nr:DUF3343 domain-containing protein [Deltaproteobacteria bacterium OttesenSCG-928-K17]
MPFYPTELILIYPTDTLLLGAEDILADMGLPYEIIPTPKKVHSACGVSLIFNADNSEKYLTALKEAGLTPGQIYRHQNGDYSLLEL